MAYGILKSGVVTDDGSEANLLCRFSAPLSVISNQPAYIQENMNLSVRASGQGIQRWELTTNIEQSSDNADFLVHSVMNGFNYVFKLRTPQIAQLKTAAGTLVENLANGATSSQVTSNSSSFNTAGGGYYTAGEFISFAGDTKVYLVTESSNLTNIKVSPNIRKTIASGATVYRGKRVMMHVRYNADVQLGITYVDGILADNGSVKFIEAI